MHLNFEHLLLWSLAVGSTWKQNPSEWSTHSTCKESWEMRMALCVRIVLHWWSNALTMLLNQMNVANELDERLWMGNLTNQCMLQMEFLLWAFVKKSLRWLNKNAVRQAKNQKSRPLESLSQKYLLMRFAKPPLKWNTSDFPSWIVTICLEICLPYTFRIILQQILPT